MTEPRRTPLYQRHVDLGARMTEFGGWEMPVWYEGISEEHEAVRSAVGLFDVSHMGEFVAHGPGAVDFLRRVLSNDAADLEVNQAQYGVIPNLGGGTVDDLLTYKLGDDVFLLVVNASNIDKDFAWLDELKEPSVKLDNRSYDKALLAVQGPKALDTLAPVTPLPIADFGYYRFDRGEVAGVQALVSRTGYTGEDGFEVMTDWGDAGAVWDALLESGSEHGIRPAGLGARDTLRLEVAFPLYGHELDEQTSAIEAGLSRFVKLDKPGMVGMERLKRDKQDGPRKKLVGFELTGRGIPRQGFAVLSEGETVGVVTSGTMSPSLDKAIGLAYVPPALAKIGTALQIDIRGRPVDAVTAKRPFYKRG